MAGALGCVCTHDVATTRFECASTEECVAGQYCRLGECRPDDDPCFEREDPRPDGTPCDDGDACTTGDACQGGACVATAPTTWPDADGDGRGDGTRPQAVCPIPEGNVATAGDCDDGNAGLAQSVAGLREDVDQDGYATGAAAERCVGDAATVDGRTYYRDGDGGYPYTPSSLGTDCAPADPARYRTVGPLVRDDDQDGYPPSNAQQSACVGQAASAGGRTYYPTGSGGFWMPVGDCINQNGGGTQCQAPFDSDDANPAVQ